MDERAFAAALAAERSFLVNYARKKFWLSYSAAEDAAQETMLRCWEARASYDDRSKFRSWAMVIMCNWIYSQKRRAWRLVFTDDHYTLDRAGAPSPFDAVYLKQVAACLQDITPEQREAVLLIGTGMAYDEAAAVAGIACGTMKSRATRGRKELRARLKETMGE